MQHRLLIATTAATRVRQGLLLGLVDRLFELLRPLQVFGNLFPDTLFYALVLFVYRRNANANMNE